MKRMLGRIAVVALGLAYNLPAASADWTDLVQQNNYASSPAAAAGLLVFTGKSTEVKLPDGSTLNACVYMAPHGEVAILENTPCAASVTL